MIPLVAAELKKDGGDRRVAEDQLVDAAETIMEDYKVDRVYGLTTLGTRFSTWMITLRRGVRTKIALQPDSLQYVEIESGSGYLIYPMIIMARGDTSDTSMVPSESRPSVTPALEYILETSMPRRLFAESCTQVGVSLGDDGRYNCQDASGQTYWTPRGWFDCDVYLEETQEVAEAWAIVISGFSPGTELTLWTEHLPNSHGKSHGGSTGESSSKGGSSKGGSSKGGSSKGRASKGGSSSKGGLKVK